MVGKITRTESGAVFDDRRMVQSSTRKGASDIIASIGGRFISIEVKNEATKDVMRDNQKKERKRVEQAGAVYVVITNIDQFFRWYDDYTAQQHYHQCDLF